MNRISRILVPVDFSEASKSAMQYGARLALQCHARFVVAHIVPDLAGFRHGFPKEVFELERRVLAQTERDLPNEVPAAYRSRINTHSIARIGDIRDELLNIVETEKIDLVVMGTHGRRGVERFFLGSVTENMLRKSPVPIISVSQQFDEETHSSERPFQKIVYATDLSESSHDGFKYCIGLVRTLGAQLTILHVLDSQQSFDFERDPSIRANLETRLRQMIEAENGAGLPLRTEIGEGIPYQRILKFAGETGANLLVINLQSTSGRERALLGSTAERVIRSARIPVLSIPFSTNGHALRTSHVDSEESAVKIA